MERPQQKKQTVREVVGIFSTAESLQEAMDELQLNGFSEQSMSVLADDKTIEKKLGHIYKRADEAADDPEAPRVAFVSKETIGQVEGALIGVPLYVAAITGAGVVVASGGALLAAMTAAALSAAAGAGAGAVFAQLFSKKYADNIQKQLDRGGMLLWVNVRSEAQERKAEKILHKHAAHGVHPHDLPA